VRKHRGGTEHEVENGASSKEHASGKRREEKKRNREETEAPERKTKHFML
jgi:hypothetical protein